MTTVGPGPLVEGDGAQNFRSTAVPRAISLNSTGAWPPVGMGMMLYRLPSRSIVHENDNGTASRAFMNDQCQHTCPGPVAGTASVD